MNENLPLYAACPICGQKVCKAEENAAVEILCPRCSSLVRVEIKNQVVHVKILEKSKK